MPFTNASWSKSAGEMPPCEVCGEPSTQWSRDMHQAEPVQGADGKMWATWEPDEAQHFRCDEHRYWERCFDASGKEVRMPRAICMPKADGPDWILWDWTGGIERDLSLGTKGK